MSPLGPVLLSLRVAAVATAVTFVIGLGLARLLWSRRVPLRFLWEAIIFLPWCSRQPSPGYLLLLASWEARPGLVRSWRGLGVSVVFTWGAAVIAAIVVSLPLMYQSCKAALLSVDARLQDAARTLGMRERRIVPDHPSPGAPGNPGRSSPVVRASRRRVRRHPAGGR